MKPMDNGPPHSLKSKKRKLNSQGPEAGNQSDSSNGSDGEANTDGVCAGSRVLLFPNLESIVANLEAAAQELLDSLERPESTSSPQFLHEAMPAVEDQPQWPLIDLTGVSQRLDPLEESPCTPSQTLPSTEKPAGRCPADTSAAKETAAEKWRKRYLKLLQTNIAIRRKHAGLKTHLAGEKERRRTAEKKSAELQEHLNTRSNELGEFAGEKEKCKAAEDHVAMLQDVLEIMSKALYSELKAKLQMQAGPPTPPWRRATPQAAKVTEVTAATVAPAALRAFAEAWDDEQEKRKAIERHCATLQGQVGTLSAELADEKEKSGQCANLQEELNAMSKKLVDLEGQMQMQKAVSGLSHGASWQYEMDDGWEAFTREGTEKMHQAYLEFLRGIPGSQRVIINSGGVDRMVDFHLMQQEHLMTRKVRRIQVSAGVPCQWITSVPGLLQQGTDLESLYIEVTDHRIWTSIRYILQHTGHAWDQTKDCSCMRRAEVKSVHRIENMRLWHRYKMRLDTMRQDHATSNISVGSADLDLDGCGNIMAQAQQTFDCGEPLAFDVDEKILLHGTSWHNANSIACEGFDHRTCQNAFYGAGVYFACAACKSHQYTCEHFKGPMWQLASTCTCERTLIISRVVLGDSYLATATRKNDRRPPVRPDSAGTYDSIVVKPGPISGHHRQQQLHQEYVIFDRDQAYPCYVVQYTV